MKPPRVLVAKVGLDGHDVGARVVARGLSDAGMEVIYTGLRQTPAKIVSTALEEDVDVVGVSIHSGAHLYFLPRIMTLLREAGAADVLVLAGGVIPRQDIPALLAVGVSKIFLLGTTVPEIAAYIHEQLQERANVRP
jgi:methylmalonyl-CoA mutase, C-terminal domain